MSRIPTPDYSNNSNSYRMNFSGMGGDDYGMGGDPNIQAWAQQAQSYRTMYVQYLQNLSQGGIDGSERQAYQTVSGYLNQLNGWLSEYGMDSGGWDPMMEGDMGGYGPMMGGMDNGMGAPQNQQPQNTYELSYQDTTSRVTETGSSTDIDMSLETDARPLNVYQKENTLTNPSNRATATVTVVADDAVPGKHMAVVTWSDGKKIIYHNIEREGFKLEIQTPDPSQVTIDASVVEFASKITATELGDSSDEVQQGTPSDEPHLWNSQNTVDYVVPNHASAQSVEERIFTDTLNLDIQNRSYTVEITKLNTHEYEIEVKDADGNVLRRINAQQVDNITITGMDADNVKYRAHDGERGDFRAWSDPTHEADSQIQVGSETSEPSHPSHPDATQPDDHQTNETTGVTTDVYNTSTDAETYVFDTDSANLDFQIPGTLTLHGASFGDKAQVESYNATTHTWVINFYKDGIRDAAHTKRITVHGDVHTKVILDVMGESSLVDTSDANKAGVQIGVSSEDSTTENSPNSTLEALKTALGGKTDAQILAALNANGFHFANIDALKTAMNATPATFPPAFSATAGSDFEKLIKALYALDGQLSGSVNGLHRANSDQYISNGRQATSRLVSLLQALYPDHNISPTYTSTSDNTQSHFNDITFDGTRFNYTRDQSTSGDSNTWDTIEVSAVTGDN